MTYISGGKDNGNIDVRQTDGSLFEKSLSLKCEKYRSAKNKEMNIYYDEVFRINESKRIDIYERYKVRIMPMLDSSVFEYNKSLNFIMLNENCFFTDFLATSFGILS